MEETITLAHGAGGTKTSELIDRLFKKYLDNPDMTSDDAAVLDVPADRIAVSTDGFIVSPPFFPGGNIGKLSVCGTVNDLACMGAEPKYLTASFVIEEGLAVSKLEDIVVAMAETAKKAGVSIVCGDTKVAGRGQVDTIFITTTGIGFLPEGSYPAGNRAQDGDSVIVTGDVGRHGAAILLSRDDFHIEADVTSDCAPLAANVRAMLDASENIHVIRDATRGGVGTVLHEIAHESGVEIRLRREDVPVQPEVAGLCGMLGLEPLYLACEGRMVVFCPAGEAEAVVQALRQVPGSENAQIIGTTVAGNAGRVVVETEIGGLTLLPEPSGELLPRIC